VNAQFKKGVIELCVLSIVAEGDCYGYELLERLPKDFTIAEGTIYPLLRRLKNQGYFETYLKESSGGPSRKYYRITPAGQELANRQRREWSQFVSSVNQIVFKGEDNE